MLKKNTRDDDSKSRLTRNQAALILLFFCCCAVVTGILVWKSIAAVVSYQEKQDRYDSLILQASKRNGVEPSLLKAVIWRESKFDHMTIGSKGEIGLMQVMQKFAATDWAKAKKCKVPTDGALMDPELNIEIGSWYLGRAIRRWSDYREANALALCEYNAGYQRAKEWKPKNKTGTVRDRIKISSTAAYVRDILNKQRDYVSDFKQGESK